MLRVGLGCLSVWAMSGCGSASELEVTLVLADPENACETSFDALESASLEVRGDHPARSSCVSIPPVQDAGSLGVALEQAGLGLEPIAGGNAEVSVHAFQGAGCRSENLLLCAKSAIQLEPDGVRELQLSTYCATLDDALARKFNDCLR